jgi:hypothetical protein
MDPELKRALIEKIRIAENDLKTPSIVKELLQKRGPRTSLVGDPKGPYNVLAEMVHKKLRKARVWEAVRDEMWRYAFDVFYRNLRRQTAVESISTARAEQLSLFPGFECLPTRVKIGNRWVKFARLKIPPFLEYVKQAQQEAVRSRRRADELEALAEDVRPFALTDLDLAQAFEKARQQAAKFGASPLPASAG